MASQRARSTMPPPRRSAGVSSETSEEIALPLRLTVARGALGLELYERVELPPFDVRALSLTLPGLSFPLDLSGGVGHFRHRRGQLGLLELSCSPAAVAKILEPHADAVVGALLRPVSAWLRPAGLSLGLIGSEGALAFDLLWAPDASHMRAVIANARGVGLGGPALAYAMRLLDAAFAGVAGRYGRLLVLERAAARLVTALLPRFGARAPDTAGVVCSELSTDAGEIFCRLEAAAHEQPLAVETVRSLETAALATAADELVLAGRLDEARAAYLDALESAPRHPDLTRAVAEIDLSVGGRAEAALALVVDTMAAIQAGLVGAELLASVGDLSAAREAVAAAVANEAYAPLAALAWARLAQHEPSPVDRLAALDRACARAPALQDIRWQRLEARLERRDLQGATADAQQLEATTHGAVARHAVCRRAARLFLDAGQKAGAGRLFERALRYLPDDPVATAGLARAFMESNKPLRAVALLERAVSLGDARGLSDAAALIDLAKVLARQVKDLPAAVSRLRQVPAASHRIGEARALEGRFRANLGDLAGASLAYAQMRDSLELRDREEPRAKRWLMEAARFEEDYQRDVQAAERHLALALTLSPGDESLGRRYRQVAALAARTHRQSADDGRGSS